MVFDNFANKCLSLIAAKSDSIIGTGKCYLGFSTTVPNSDGTNIAEPAQSDYPSYKRIKLNTSGSLDKWGSVDNGIVSNMYELVSNEALEGEDGDENNGWPEFVWFVIFDDETEGNPLVGDVLRDPNGIVDDVTGLLPEQKLKVNKNRVAVFQANTLQLTLK